MQVREIMTRMPAYCSTETRLPEAARLMLVHDCGEVPVLDVDHRPIGVITDRDITCRVVAQGKDPRKLMVGACMTSPCITVVEDLDVAGCCQVLEENQIRRAPVIDSHGRCIGIIALADIAQVAQGGDTVRLVREVSRPASA